MYTYRSHLVFYKRTHTPSPPNKRATPPPQTESETYAKNAYGAPKGLGSSSSDSTGKGAAGAAPAGEERKLGGYRLVRFNLIPFEDVYFQHAAAANATYAEGGEVRVRSTSAAGVRGGATVGGEGAKGKEREQQQGEASTKGGATKKE